MSERAAMAVKQDDFQRGRLFRCVRESQIYLGSRE